MRRADVISSARSYVGVRWRHRGRSRRGVDCGGLLACVCQDLGYPFVDVPEYRRVPDGQLLECLLKNGDLVSDPRPGDVLAFWMDRGSREAQHVGVYAGSTVIHALACSRAVVEHGLSDFWLKRVVAAVSFRNLED